MGEDPGHFPCEFMIQVEKKVEVKLRNRVMCQNPEHGLLYPINKIYKKATAVYNCKKGFFSAQLSLSSIKFDVTCNV